MAALETALLGLAVLGLVLAAVPAALTGWNLLVYRAPRRLPAMPPNVSLLIPARNEAGQIGATLEAALASRDVDLEIIVLDDGSTDGTAEIVQSVASHDRRVRLLTGAPPPEGWSGKMFACHLLAAAASAPVLVFLDADVRLEPYGLARAVGFLEDAQADLASGIPRQRTGSLAERTLIPLIHHVLLGYLPLWAMRRSPKPAFAAGCGQLMVVRREAYELIGGHAAVRATFHDGLQMPRAFRRAGLVTDLFDATGSASCRMYDGARTVVAGLAKNAHEGLGTPVGRWLWSFLLLGGAVLPPTLTIIGAVAAPAASFMAVAAAGWLVALGHRGVLALRFRQPLTGVLLHPVGVLVLVAIQWWAHAVRRRGRGVLWKGRAAPAALILAAALALLAPGAAIADGAGAPLTIELAGLQPGGEVAVAVFADADSFARRESPVARVWLVPDGGTLTWTAGALPPGTYAVAAWQDLDGDGELERGAFGIPREPWGVSGDARRMLGPPRFAASAFRHGTEGATVRVRLE